MSRRKQSNPKPHKPGDEDTCWSNEDEEKMLENLEHNTSSSISANGKESTPSGSAGKSITTPPLSSKQENSMATDSRTGLLLDTQQPPIGLRINTLLATDPAKKEDSIINNNNVSVIKCEQQQLIVEESSSLSSYGNIAEQQQQSSVIKRVSSLADDVVQTGNEPCLSDNNNNGKQQPLSSSSSGPQSISDSSSSSFATADPIPFITIKTEPSSSPPIGLSPSREQQQEYTTQALTSQPPPFSTVFTASKNLTGGGSTVVTPVVQSTLLSNGNCPTTELPRIRIDASTDTTNNNKLGYVCPPCGIKFSSPSTLEAHQTYYCSHRPRKISKGGTESEDEGGRVFASVASYDQDDSSSGADTVVPDSAMANGNSNQHVNKVCKTGKQYRCTHCSYSADKKVSLNRHMRMHSVSPATSVTNDSDSIAVAAVSQLQQQSQQQLQQQQTTSQTIDRYCQECDIRFSNLKTFRAHKMHYCSTRNVIKTTAAAATNPLSPSALSLDHSAVNSPPIPTVIPNCVSPPPPPFLALPTNPILIVPYSLIQAASILSTPMVPSMASQNAAYFLLPDGTLQLVTQTMQQPILSHNHVPTNVATSVLQPTQPNQVQIKDSITDRRSSQLFPNLVPLSTAPLDLSLKKNRNFADKENLMNRYEEEDKENHHHHHHQHRDVVSSDQQYNSADHEDIVCAPSIPLLLSAASSNSTPSPTPSISPPRDSRLDDNIVVGYKHNPLYGVGTSSPPPPPHISTSVPYSKTAAKRLINGITKAAVNKSAELDNNADKTNIADLSVNTTPVLNGAATDPRFLADVLLAAAATVFESAQNSAAANNSNTNNNNNNAIINPSSKIQTAVAAGDRLPFPPEMLPHLTSTLAQLSSSAFGMKRPSSVSPPTNHLPSVASAAAAAVTANTPLAFAQDLRNNPAILPFLTSEMVRLASSASSAAPNFACTVVPPTPPFARQGTWKCEDCNIGFCKYENYLAHKKHYCSTRKVQQDHQSKDPPPITASTVTATVTATATATTTTSSAANTTKASVQRTSPVGSPSTKPSSPSQPSVVVLNKDLAGSPMNHVVNNNNSNSNNNNNSNGNGGTSTTSGSNNLNTAAGKQSLFVHVVCNLCGIKFTSLDNLTTHQTYYCPNRNLIQETDKSSLKCTKCKVLLPVDQLPIHQCGNTASAIGSGWKCPCCLVIFATADAVQKHIQSHSGIKAFLCTICNYKGNTIRGMRTHIRVHFNKRNMDVMEENYISCILEEAAASGSPPIMVDEVTPVVAATLSSDRKSRKSSCSSEEVAVVVCNGDSQSKINNNNNNNNNGGTPEAIEEDDEDEFIDVDEIPSPRSIASGKREKKSSSCTSISEDDVAAAKSPIAKDGNRIINDNNSSSDESTCSSNNSSGTKSNSNYCDSCDISFNYLSTFIAHKKYYCTTTKRAIMRDISSSPPIDGITIPVNGPSEAAIQIT